MTSDSPETTPAVAGPEEAVARAALVAAGAWLGARGWLPATAGNLSARLGDGSVVVTASGTHKGELCTDDFVRVDLEGVRLDAGARRASDETALHLCVYRNDPAAGAVLHTHSVAATVLSRRVGEMLVFDDFELAKAFAGVRTHATRLVVPVVDNDQDMVPLAAAIEHRWRAGAEAGAVVAPAFVIRGHGAYVWAADIAAARHGVEALEFLLECRLHERD